MEKALKEMLSHREWLLHRLETATFSDPQDYRKFIYTWVNQMKEVDACIEYLKTLLSKLLDK
jgi:hypothetical protein